MGGGGGGGGAIPFQDGFSYWKNGLGLFFLDGKFYNIKMCGTVVNLKLSGLLQVCPLLHGGYSSVLYCGIKW